MPAKDIYHDNVKNCLVKDSWTITHDPLRLQWGQRDLYVDLGAERLLAAEKAGRKIAVEIKSFIGASILADLEQALGQYLLYHHILSDTEPERKLYIAVKHSVFKELFDGPIGKALLEKNNIQLMVFDPKQEEIIRWTP